MVPMLLVMLLPFVAFSVQRQARGRLEIRQVREGGGLDHSPETFAEYVPVPAVDESWQVIQAHVLDICANFFGIID